MTKKIIPTEHIECVALHQYLELKGIRHSHINNGAWLSSWRQKAKSKEAGVSPGVPDYIIILPNRLLFIEMKISGNRGVVSKFQKDWIKAINDIGGNVEALVCRGFDEAKKEIDKRLK